MPRAGQIALPHLIILLWLCAAVKCCRLQKDSSGLGRWVLQELKQNLAKELDFRMEARNAQRLAACMASRRRVAIPEPVPQVSPFALLPSQTSALLLPRGLSREGRVDVTPQGQACGTACHTHPGVLKAVPGAWACLHMHWQARGASRAPLLTPRGRVLRSCLESGSSPWSGWTAAS